MDKPSLEDYDLTPESAREVVAENKKQYKKYWLTVHALTLLFILTVAALVPASSENKIIIAAGLIFALYILNYFFIFRLITKPFFKGHPLTQNLRKYNQESLKYKKSLTGKE